MSSFGGRAEQRLSGFIEVKKLSDSIFSPLPYHAPPFNSSTSYAASQLAVLLYESHHVYMDLTIT